MMIALGFVLCVLGGQLVLLSGSPLTRRWYGAWFWGALTVGMIYFTGVSLINGWVMHYLADRGAPATESTSMTRRASGERSRVRVINISSRPTRSGTESVPLAAS